MLRLDDADAASAAFHDAVRYCHCAFHADVTLRC